MSKIITRPGAPPAISYGYDVPAHIFRLFEQHLATRVRRDLLATFEQLNREGRTAPRDEIMRAEDSGWQTRVRATGEQVLRDIPVGAFDDPRLFAWIKRRVDTAVRKRFAVLSDAEYNAEAQRWPRRCYRHKEAFYDERLQELRLLPYARPPGRQPTLEERGMGLTQLIGRELYRKSRHPSLAQLYEQLHDRRVSEETAGGMANSILDALGSAIPELCEVMERSSEMRERLHHATVERGGVGFDGSRPRHYHGTIFLARHLAAIAIGSPSDSDQTVRAREDLIGRRLSLKDGHIRMFAHAARQVR